MHEVPDSAWAALGVSLAAFFTMFGSIIVAWLGKRRRSSRDEAIADRLKKLNDNTEPIANGFTDEIRETLDELQRTSEKNADAIAENAKGIRDLHTILHQFTNMFAQHLQNHPHNCDE